MLVKLIMLMIPCLFIILLGKSQLVSCALWHVGNTDYANDPMSILCIVLAITGSELCHMTC